MSRGSNTMREVSRVHSTRRLKLWSEKDRRRNKKLQPPYGKEQIRRKKKLNPHYVAGFIDGEGCFSVSIGKHKTLKRGYEVQPEFEIEIRKDDQEVLERIVVTIGAGRIYDCSYERYGWFPHAKYKITSIWEMKEYLFHFPNARNFILRMWEPSVPFVRTVVYPSRSNGHDDSLKHLLIVLTDFYLEFRPNFIPSFEGLVFTDRDRETSFAIDESCNIVRIQFFLPTNLFLPIRRLQFFIAPAILFRPQF